MNEKSIPYCLDDTLFIVGDCWSGMKFEGGMICQSDVISGLQAGCYHNPLPVFVAGFGI